MNIPTRTIRADIKSLVSDRLWNIENGNIKDNGRLRSICYLLQAKLDALQLVRINRHNRHMKLLRQNHSKIYALANTITDRSNMRHVRDRIIELCLQVNQPQHTPVIHQKVKA